MARKKTGDKVSSVASKAMRTGKATPKEIRSMGASLLSQDEVKEEIASMGAISIVTSLHFINLLL